MATLINILNQDAFLRYWGEDNSHYVRERLAEISALDNQFKIEAIQHGKYLKISPIPTALDRKEKTER